MNRLFRYLCGVVVLVGVLLIPTGSSDGTDDPAALSGPVQQEHAAPAPAANPAAPADAYAALTTP